MIYDYKQLDVDIVHDLVYNMPRDIFNACMDKSNQRTLSDGYPRSLKLLRNHMMCQLDVENGMRRNNLSTCGNGERGFVLAYIKSYFNPYTGECNPTLQSK